LVYNIKIIINKQAYKEKSKDIQYLFSLINSTYLYLLSNKKIIIFNKKLKKFEISYIYINVLN